MKKKIFKAEILAGHKDDAVEVPFDPAAVWGVAPKSIWKGRRGHEVSGSINGIAFAEGFIVPRAKKFFLTIDRDMEQAAGVAVGETVRISLAPRAGNSGTK